MSLKANESAFNGPWSETLARDNPICKHTVFSAGWKTNKKRGTERAEKEDPFSQLLYSNERDPTATRESRLKYLSAFIHGFTQISRVSTWLPLGSLSQARSTAPVFESREHRLVSVCVLNAKLAAPRSAGWMFISRALASFCDFVLALAFFLLLCFICEHSLLTVENVAYKIQSFSQ